MKKFAHQLFSMSAVFTLTALICGAALAQAPLANDKNNQNASDLVGVPLLANPAASGNKKPKALPLRPAPGRIGNAVFHDSATGLTMEILPLREGMQITGVRRHSAAYKAGLEVGDIIVRINGLAMTDQDRFFRALRKARGESHLLVRDIRSGRLVHHQAFLPVRVKPAPPITPINADLRGLWHSSLGDVEFTQRGSRVIGRIHFSDGSHGTMEGRVVGRRVNFFWYRTRDMHGIGALELLPHNRKLYGSYSDTVSNTTGVWMLTR